MDNENIEVLQRAFADISEELQSIKTQNVRNAVNIDKLMTDINENLETLSKGEFDTVSKESFYSAQEQLAGYITKNIIAEVNSVSDKVNDFKASIEAKTDSKSLEVREILGGLSLKIAGLQDALTSYSDEKHEELKKVLDDLDNVSKTTIANIERNTLFGLSGLNTNIETLSKTVSAGNESFEKQNRENFENLISSITALTTKIELYAGDESRETLNSLTDEVKDVKGKIETTNEQLAMFLRSELTEMKNAISELPQNLNEIAQRVNTVALAVVSQDNPMSREIAQRFNELNGQLESIKYNLNFASADNGIVEQVAAYISDLQNSVKQYGDNTADEFENFKSALKLFNENLANYTSINDGKLTESLNETSSIKRDILELKDSLNSQNTLLSAATLSTISEKLDSVFVELSRFESAYTENNEKMLKDALDSVENSFKSVLSEIEANKMTENAANGNFLQALGEKTDLLKNELNLATSDILSEIKSQNSFEDIQAIKQSFEDVLQASISVSNEKMIGEIQQYIKSITALIQGNTNVNPEFFADFKNIEVNIDKLFRDILTENQKTLENVKLLSDGNSAAIIALQETMFEDKNELSDKIQLKSDELQAFVKDIIEEKTESIQDITRQTAIETRDMSEENTEKLLQKISEIDSLSKDDLKNIETLVEDSSNEIKTLLEQQAGDFSEKLSQTTVFTQTKTSEFIDERFKALQDELIKGIENVSLSQPTDTQSQTKLVEVFSEKAESMAKEFSQITYDALKDFKEETKDIINVQNEDYTEKSSELTNSIQERFSSLLDEKLTDIKDSLLAEIKIQVPEKTEEQAINLDFTGEISEKIANEVKNTFEQSFEVWKNEFDPQSAEFEYTDMTEGLKQNVQEQIQRLKSDVLADFEGKFQDFKEFFVAQSNMLKLSAEIKRSIGELEEKFVESNVNSTMEISKLLFSLINEVSKLKRVEKTEDENGEISVSQKSSLDFSVVEKSVFDAKEEIKRILAIQHPLIKKIDSLGQKEDLEILQNNLTSVLVTFNAKLDELTLISKNSGSSSTVNENLESLRLSLNQFGKDLISGVVNVFNGISFNVEKEDIKDFIKEQSDALKTAVTEFKENYDKNFETASLNLSELKTMVSDFKQEFADFKEGIGNIELLSNQLSNYHKDLKIASVENKLEVIDVLKQSLKDDILNNITTLIENVSFAEDTQKIETNIAESREQINEVVNNASSKINAYLEEKLPQILTFEQSEKQSEAINEEIKKMSSEFIEKISSIESFKDVLNDQTYQSEKMMSDLKSDVVDIVRVTFNELFEEKAEILFKSVGEEFAAGFNSVKDVVKENNPTLDVTTAIEAAKQNLSSEIVSARKLTEDSLAKINENALFTLQQAENNLTELINAFEFNFKEFSKTFNDKEEYRTKVFEGLNLLKSKIEETGEIITQEFNKSVKEEILNDFSQKNVVLENALNEIKNQSQKIFSDLTVFEKENTSELSQKLDVLKSDISKQTEELVSILNGNRQTVSDRFDLTNSVISQAEEKIFEYLQSNIPQIATLEQTNEQAMSIRAEIQHLSSEFIQRIDSVDVLNNLLKDSVKNFQDGLQELRINILDIVKSTFEDAFEQKYEKLEKVISDSFEEKFVLIQKILDDNSTRNDALSNKNIELVQETGELIQKQAKMLEEKSDEIKSELTKHVSDVVVNTQQAILENIEKTNQKTETLSNELSTELKNSKIEVEEKLENYYQQIENSVADVSGSLNAVENNLLEKTDDLSQKAQALANELSDKVRDTETAITEKIDKNQEYSEKMSSKLLEELSSQFDFIESNLKDKIDEFKDNDGKSVEEISEKIINVEKSIADKIEKTDENLDANFSNISSDIDEKVSNLKTTLTDLFENLFDKTENIPVDIKSEIKRIEEDLKEKLENISHKTEDFPLTVKSEVDEAKASLVEKIETINEKTTSFTEQISAEIGEQVNNLTTVIKENNEADSIRSCISDIEDSLKLRSDEIKKELKGTAKNIEELSNTTDTGISDIKELISNKFEDIDEIKSEIRQIPKENNVSLNGIEKVLEEKLDALREDLDLMPKDSLELEDIQSLLDTKIANLKADLSELQTSSNYNLEDIFELLDTRTEALNNKMKSFASSMPTLDEIKDITLDGMEDIKAEIISTAKDNNNRIDGLIENLDTIQDKTENVAGRCVDIRGEIENVKDHLKEIQDSIKNNESDYPYTFEDIETDILKVRMILKDLTETNALARDEGLEKIEEDLVSISTRTNKLLLSSEETSNFLQSSIEDLKNLVTLFDNKVNEFDNQKMFDKAERKIDEITNIVYDNAQSNKKLTEAFTYLAEWIDKTDEKLYAIESKMSDLNYIKQNMIKKSDLEGIFEKVAKKMEKQQEKIKTLEEKVKLLSKKDVPTLVKEVLSSVPDMKSNTKLVKKVDGIDKQLAILGKSIEKITSYVD